MPSLDHEAPLAVLRREPALVAVLLREALGVELPRFDGVEIGDPDFNQPLPTEFRADLVVLLRGEAPAHAPVMGIVVEVQRARDDRKRRSWPVYVATLHARLDCPTCLVVITDDDAIARWAATPIATLQPGSSFVPLVLGPSQVPVVTAEAQARQAPGLAVLSALAHGNGPCGLEVVIAAFAAISELPREQGIEYYVLICASLNEVMRRAVEKPMHSIEPFLVLDWQKKHYYAGKAEGKAEGKEEGKEEGKLDAARSFVIELAERRLGAVGDELRLKVEACTDTARLRSLALEVGTAADLASVERLLASL